MRMWNVDPKLMCNQHLLGEHVEMHMFVGCLTKGKNIDGYIQSGFVEVHNIVKRHEELAKEFLRRGFKHSSSLQEFNHFISGKVNIKANEKKLQERVEELELSVKERVVILKRIPNEEAELKIREFINERKKQGDNSFDDIEIMENLRIPVEQIDEILNKIEKEGKVRKK